MPKPTTELPSSQVVPNPQHEKRTYRYFSAADKRRILAEAEACAHGELGALLRRENIYSTQLQTWRKQLAETGESGLENSVAGRKPAKNSTDKTIEALQREKAKLEQRLQVAEGLLELQKKAFSLLEHLNNASRS
jgi:transposase-like protein